MPALLAQLGLSASHRVLVDFTAPLLHPSSIAALAVFALLDLQLTIPVQLDRSARIQAPFQCVLQGNTALFDPRRLPLVFWVSTVQ